MTHIQPNVVGAVQAAMSAMKSFFSSFKTPEPLPVIAVANAVLDSAWAIGSPTNAPRLQRLVMLCDGFSQSILGQRLVNEELCFAGDMPFFTDLHTAFRRWNADPIKVWGNHPGLAIPYIVEIDELRSRIITSVVGSFAPVPTWQIPREPPAKN